MTPLADARLRRQLASSMSCAAALLALLLTGCGGRPAQSLTAAGAQAPGTVQGRVDVAPGTAGTERELADPALDRAWQALLAHPGTPWVDYHPRRLTVVFKAGAKLPAAALGAGAARPAGQRAADQGNALLREDRSFEPLADAIAARFNLTFRNQIYNAATRLVGYELPAGTDGEAVLAGIRRDFGAELEYATYSRIFHLTYAPTDPDYVNSTDAGGLGWQLHKMHCAEAWDSTKGDNAVRVAILDTGCNLSHEELAGPVLDPQVAFPTVQCDPGRGDNDVTDTYSHGTGTAGLVVALQDDGKSFCGVAPDCRVIPIRVADADNYLLDSAIVAGGYLAKQLGAKVINMSFGDGADDPAIHTMCNTLHNQGLLLCASAGNDDSAASIYPAKYSSCLSVGATDVSDARISHPGWWGSNYGPDVALAAPGEQYESSSIPNSNSYQDFGGTSGAAPLVAACAALAWCVRPEWTNDEVRAALIATGAPTTGFTGSVPRVDIGNFMAQYGWGFTWPADPRLIQHGVVPLAPTVFGSLTQLTAYLDDAPVQNVTAPPWELSVDTAGHSFDTATLRLDGTNGTTTLTESRSVVLDNTAPVYPLYDWCDAPDVRLLYVDAARLNPAALSQLYLLSSPWTPAQLANGGPGAWELAPVDADDPAQGSCYHCGLPGGGYGPYELDCLMTQRLDLTSVNAPTLTFLQHYNIQDGGQQRDRGVVLVSADDGLTWTTALQHDGSPAVFSGAVPDWQRTEVDLAPFAGAVVHVAFTFMSDGSFSGEDAQTPGGWWLDELVFATGYAGKPRCAGVSIDHNAIAGAQPGVSQLMATLLDPHDVVRAQYTLDLAPLGVGGGDDQSVSAGPGEAVPFNFALTEPNQTGLLTVQCYGPGDVPGQQLSLPIYLFNLRGDANADNTINALDSETIRQHIGAHIGEPGYLPFCDSDGDGVITEADGAIVGYAWGQSL